MLHYHGSTYLQNYIEGSSTKSLNTNFKWVLHLVVGSHYIQITPLVIVIHQDLGHLNFYLVCL